MSDQIERLAGCLAEGFRESLRSQQISTAPTTSTWAAGLAHMVEEALAARGSVGLAQALGEALHLAAERADQVSVAVTGLGWLGGGVPAVERVLAELISGAQREIMLTAYSVTPGSDRIWPEIEHALATGIRVVVIIDRLGEQHEGARSFLYHLVDSYHHSFSLYNFAADNPNAGLHAKVVIVDRKVALVGSANLSFRGMVTAHEMATIVQGPTADLIAQRLDALIGSPLVKRLVGGQHK